LVLGVFLWLDLRRPIFDFRAKIYGPLNNRPVTIPFAVGFLLLAFAASQAAWRVFADRYNPTVLLLAEEQCWELASFVADLKRFHRGHLQQNKNSLTHIMFEAVLMSKGELELALATKPLVDHEEWEAFQTRLSEFGADPYWVHDYPVADTRHFNPRHWIAQIDGDAFPYRDWSRIVSANTSRELTIHGGSYRSNDLLHAPNEIGSLLLVNPKIERDFNASVIRQFNNFTVWVDTIEPLLKNPRLLVELAHNGTFLLVRYQSTTEVQNLIETADFELAKCLKVSSVEEYGTRVDPMPRTKFSIHVDSVFEDLNTSSWSTDSHGQTTGVRLGPDGVLPEISGSVGTVPKNSTPKSLRWLYIDCIKHGSVRNIDPALQELIPNAKLVIANQIGHLDDLRQLLSNARTAGNLRTKSLQLSWHEGYGVDIARDLDDYPGITTLFIEYSPDHFEDLFPMLSCWTDLERLVFIASPSSIDELIKLDDRCNGIYDGPVNLTELLQSCDSRQSQWRTIFPADELTIDVFVVPRTISNTEKVELIAE
jgi:hypothetical protein